MNHTKLSPNRWTASTGSRGNSALWEDASPLAVLLRLLLMFMLTVLALSLAAPARAGANETPGENYRPHRFGYFSPNLWEFGKSEIAIFNRIVVGSQHYTAGAAYTDAKSDYSPGGGGVWNFFTFCTDRRHDVMFVTAHGFKQPSTLVESYPYDSLGMAVRDSVLGYWNGIFVAGSFAAYNWRNHTYAIVATQTFYTTYFQTPQAFAWWSTCWSSLLSMTNPAEARCYVGYDDNVSVGKSKCDENRVLGRMDGQETQDLRPLLAAVGDINVRCPPDKARLVAKGALNTTLSPSVLQNTPTGTVCTKTPGFVRFDTSLDTRVPPQNVVVAYGDGFLDNHKWVGDDVVTYDVNPTTIFPTIIYDVIESQAISRADLARLDGNRNPPVNARGPNQDDFVWHTDCPFGFQPFCLTTDLIYTQDPAPGQIADILTPLVNQTDVGQEITVTVSFPASNPPWDSTSVIVGPRSSQLLTWPHTIPATAQEQDSFPVAVTIRGVDGPFVHTGFVRIGPRIRTCFTSPTRLAAGQSNTVTVRVENRCGQALDLAGVQLQDPQGWATAGTTAIHLESGEVAEVDWGVVVPPGILPDAVEPFTLSYHLGTASASSPVGDATVGLPLVVTRGNAVDLVPGNNDATIPIEILSLSLVSVSPVVVVGQCSEGWPVTVHVPPNLPPNVPLQGTLTLAVPQDSTLIGHTGKIHLTITDQFGYSSTSEVNFTVEPAIELQEYPLDMCTGWAIPHMWPWAVRVRNRSDVPISGTLRRTLGSMVITPQAQSFNLSPNGYTTLTTTAVMPPDYPAGVQMGNLQVATASGLGSQTVSLDKLVTTPVTVEMIGKAFGAEPGASVLVQGVLKNVRTSNVTQGSYHWTDERGWLSGQAAGEFMLGPLQAETLQVTIQIPFTKSAELDSTLVTLSADMWYDTGTVATTDGGIEVCVIENATSGVDGPAPAAGIGLQSVTPNPFRPRAGIAFRMAHAGRALLTVHDALGRRVTTLVDEQLPAGEHRRVWDGTTQSGAPAPAGVYFLRLETAEGRWSERAVRLR